MKKNFLLFIMILLLPTLVFAQKIQSMEFQNQEITDILLVLAEVSGISIVPDDTVTGKASFYFVESTIETALSNFLPSYKLYYTKTNSIIYVSRIYSKFSPETNKASIKADDVAIETLIRNLSKIIGKTILYDTLPKTVLSVDIVDLTIPEILEILTKKIPDYLVISNENYYYIQKNQIETISTSKKKNIGITRNGDLYSISLEKGRLLELLTDFFSISEKEYSFLITSDIQLENLYFSNKNFITILKLILEQGNADFVEKNDIYYIVELQRKDVIKKLKTTELYELTWIQAQDIPSLLPTDLSSSSILKVDKNTNTLLITGTEEETQPLKNFIRTIDRPLNGLQYKKIDIKFFDAKEIINIIPQKMIQVIPVLIPGSNSILATGTKETIETLENFILGIDSKKPGTPIRLKYIQAEELLANIPPSLSTDLIMNSGYPNLLFYKGTEENKEIFLHELSLIDRPKPQVRYQLLVIEYTNSKSSFSKPSISIGKTSDTENISFLGDLSNIMSLSFDVISKFGYEFAIALNAQITNHSANIYTDTTLTALSGEDIKFQNTDTYRYIESEVDVTTGESVKKSTTQQITSGLIVSLNGWVSGDNMITMSVNATISKQNTNSSGSGTSLTTLPSTSERVVNTQIRTMSGEPIVISGLIKEDETVTEQKVPLLGQIPLLGNLFKHSSKSKEKTEIVIYIVPHLIRDSEGNGDNSLRLERYYTTYLGTK